MAGRLTAPFRSEPVALVSGWPPDVVLARIAASAPTASSQVRFFPGWGKRVVRSGTPSRLVLAVATGGQTFGSPYAVVGVIADGGGSRVEGRIRPGSSVTVSLWFAVIGLVVALSMAFGPAWGDGALPFALFIGGYSLVTPWLYAKDRARIRAVLEDAVT